jgi:RimJ/RimL family protein N-acetyltransferase
MSDARVVALRAVTAADLEVFFSHMQDPEAVWMAAFTPPDPSDREAFDAHWARLVADESIIARAIDVDAGVIGNIASFDMLGDREITYWLDRAVWGRGIATEALRLFLDVESTRPLFGRAARDNIGSIRVMEKCGFALVGTDRGFSTARNREIDEVVMRLD